MHSINRYQDPRSQQHTQLIPGLPDVIAQCIIFPLCRPLLLKISVVCRSWKSCLFKLLSECQFKDNCPKAVILRFPNLSNLILRPRIEIKKSDLTRLTKLNSLSITGPSSITSHILRHLTGLTRLTLWGNRSITMRGLLSLPNLTCLELRQNLLIRNRGLAALTNLTHLLISDGSNLIFTSAPFVHLTNLTSLALRFCSRIENQALVPLTSLRELSLYDCPKISNDGLSNLTRLTRLEIQGYDNQLTLGALKPLTNLQLLRLQADDFENEELEKIRQMARSGIRVNLCARL